MNFVTKRLNSLTEQVYHERKREIMFEGLDGYNQALFRRCGLYNTLRHK